MLDFTAMFARRRGYHRPLTGMVNLLLSSTVLSYQDVVNVALMGRT